MTAEPENTAPDPESEEEPQPAEPLERLRARLAEVNARSRGERL